MGLFVATLIHESCCCLSFHLTCRRFPPGEYLGTELHPRDPCGYIVFAASMIRPCGRFRRVFSSLYSEHTNCSIWPLAFGDVMAAAHLPRRIVSHFSNLSLVTGPVQTTCLIRQFDTLLGDGQREDVSGDYFHLYAIMSEQGGTSNFINEFSLLSSCNTNA